MFMALELDRSNIAQAVTDNFLPNLHMNTNGIKYSYSFMTCLLIAAQTTTWGILCSSWHSYALSCRLSLYRNGSDPIAGFRLS
jgi:hypothetical protein